MTPADLRKLIEADHDSGENGSDAWHELAEALVRYAPRIAALWEAAEGTYFRHGNGGQVVCDCATCAAVRAMREGA